MKINLIKNRDLSWRSIFDNLTELSWLAAIFFIPLFFAAFLRTEHVFELNKIFLAQVFLILLIFFTLTREIFFPAKLWGLLGEFFKKFWLIPTLFILGLIVSLFFSENLTLSFFGAIDRQQGFLSYLLYFLYFIFLSFNLAVFKERDLEEGKPNINLSFKPVKIKKLLPRAIKKIFLTILASTFFVATYGILQFLGLDIYHWQEAALYTGRAFSSLGQPNFFASWLLLVLPISFWFFYQAKNFLLKFFYFLIFIATLLGLISSGSRGALLAFFGAIFISLIYLFFSSRIKLSLRKKTTLFGLAIILVLTFSLVLELISPGRITSLTNFNGGSVSARLDFYQASVEAIKLKPIFGYGQENLYEAFLPYYQTSWSIHGDVGQVPDRAHNIFLDILMSHGFFGLIFYSLLFAFFFFLLIKLLKLKNFHDRAFALSFGVLAYLLSLLFSFAVVSTEFYFFIFLALLVIFNYQEDESFKSHQLKRGSKFSGYLRLKFERLFINKKFKVFIFIIILALSILGLERAGRVYLADYYFAGARQAYINGDLSESLTFLDYIDETKTNPVNQAYYAKVFADLILPFYPFKAELSLDKLIKDRLELILESLSLKETRDLLVRAQILTAFNNFDEANFYLNLAREKSPNWPSSILVEAHTYLAQKNSEQALKTFYFLLVSLPETTDPLLNQGHLEVVRMFKKEALVNIAEIFASRSEYALAEKYYRLAYVEDSLNHTLLKKIADQLYLQARFEEALALVEDGARLSPKDYNWPLLAYYLSRELGRESEADVWYNRAIDLGFQGETEQTNILID
ncbi:O-antigen ligase family protein [Patescibacteria group bacterium]|nr:O-antigen ligase family protein [Patescibacteria group bacterium]